MSHVKLFILAIIVECYLTKLHILPCVLMYTVEQKAGDQVEFPDVFQHAACDRAREVQHTKYQQF